MTTVENNPRILPGSPQWDELLGRIAAGAKDRDLNDENPFDQVAALKRAGLYNKQGVPAWHLEYFGYSGVYCLSGYD